METKASGIFPDYRTERFQNTPPWLQEPYPMEFQCCCGDPDCPEVVDCEGVVCEKCEKEILACAPPND